VVDSGALSIRFRLTEGTRIEETKIVVNAIFKNIDEVVKPEELQHSYGFAGTTKEGVGVALGFDEGSNVGSIGFKLVDRDQRDRSAVDIAALLRSRVEKIPGISKIRVQAQSAITAALIGAGKPISLEIQGADLKQSLAFAQQVKSAMETITGLVDIDISQKDPRPEIWVDIDRKKASDLGLNITTIAGTLRNYFYGAKATEFKDAGDSFDVFTRFTQKDKDRLRTLPNVPLFTPDGRMIKLKNIAKIVQGEGPELAELGTPPGISIHFGGDVEEQQKAFRDLKILLTMGIILVYMIMASLFGNLRDPFIIMFSVPFAFSGVLYAFYFTGVTLGIMSFMGVVMLMGIVVNNAIVLLDYIHLLQKRGEPLFIAVTRAGRNRLRPVLMTTLTTFFGLFPMAISERVGAEAWNPLGITMLGGLSVSTLVTLVLVPTVYYMFESRKLKKK
jgi:HAE1 family hydrophobic/amphiphilic exporter-1